MLTLALLVAAAMAAGHGKFECGEWTQLTTADGYKGAGKIMLFAQNDKLWVTSEGLTVTKDDVLVEGKFVGHVHAKKCEDEDAGGHWLIDAAKPAKPVVEANELWIPEFMNVASYDATQAQTEKDGADYATMPMAFVLHEITDGNPKRVCCNLGPHAAKPAPAPGPKAPAPAPMAPAPMAPAPAPAMPVYKCDGKEVPVAEWATMAQKCVTDADAECTSDAQSGGFLPDASDDAKTLTCKCMEVGRDNCADKCVVEGGPKPTEEQVEMGKVACEKICGDGAGICQPVTETAPAPVAGPGPAPKPAPAPAKPIVYKCDGMEVEVVEWAKIAGKCLTDAKAECTPEAQGAGYSPEATEEAKTLTCECAKVNMEKCANVCTVENAPKVTDEQAMMAKESCEKVCGKDAKVCAVAADTTSGPGEMDGSAATVALSAAAAVVLLF